MRARGLKLVDRIETAYLNMSRPMRARGLKQTLQLIYLNA